MKIKSVTFLLSLITAACVFSACNSSDNKGEMSQAYKDSVALSANTPVDTQSTAQADWEKYKADANEKIRQNDDSIQAFKKRTDKEDSKLKVKYNKMIANMEERNNEMKAKLADSRYEDKVKFEKFRTSFDTSMDSLGTSIKDLFKKKK